jgi:hypothetical protein
MEVTNRNLESDLIGFVTSAYVRYEDIVQACVPYKGTATQPYVITVYVD